MIIIKPAYYKDFQCIAGACPDSCCQGWEVDADEASLRYYQTLDTALEIRQRIDRVLDKDEFGNTIFALAPKKRCPFLNEENLCDMHIAIGGEHTPVTCRNFPRFIYDFGGTREIGISFSCPVAADLIYKYKGHLTFDREINDELPSLNDIDALTYMQLKKARSEAIALMQDDSLTVKERLLRLLDSGVMLQKELGDYEEGGDELPFMEVFDNPELINPEWQEHVKSAVVQPVVDCAENEHIAVYFLYKYFLQAVYDRDVLSKIKMAVIGVLIHTYFGANAWTMHLWSKETEHSQYNMDRYQRLLKEADCLRAEQLKSFLE